MAFANKPAAPFLWGRGGRRLSSDAIDMQRRLAAQQMATGSDFSPLGHWTQGLARVANSVVGGIQMNRADRAAEERQAAQEQSIAALLADYDPASGEPDPVVAALADPELRQLGMSVLEARRQPAWEPNNDFERALIESGVERGSPEWQRYNAMRREGIADPVIFGEVAGRNFAGPRSWVVEDIMGGGDPASGASGAAAPQASYPAPPQEAVLELLQNPDTASQFDEVFGPGASAQVFAARQSFREVMGR